MMGASGFSASRGSNTAGSGSYFDLDELHRLLGDLLGLGRHQSDDLSPVAHLVVGEHRLVRDDEAVDVVRSVFGRRHRSHPGQPLGRARVQIDDAGVVLGAQQRLRVEHAGQVEVVGVLHPARDLLTGIDPGAALPDFS